MSVKSSVKRFNRKPLWKRILAVVLGLVTIGGAVFGVTKLVEYVNDDLKTIHPSFEVGALGTDGKYVEDEEKLYTKDAFRCDGLQVKLDFDNEISYKIYFYDDVGKFVSSTDTYTEGVDAKVNGTYARITIIPTDDEIGKINFREKVDLSNQIEIKVLKKQNSKYLNLGGRNLLATCDVNDLVFVRGSFSVSSMSWTDTNTAVVTGSHLLAVNNFKEIGLNEFEGEDGHFLSILQFKLVDEVLFLVEEQKYTSKTEGLEFVELNKEAEYILISSGIKKEEGGAVKFLEWTESQINELPSRIIYR